MFVTQRPLTVAAVTEASGPPAWKTIPSWFIYGDADRAIPLGALELMATRPKPREIIVLEGGSHVVMVSQPDAAAALIERAANAVAEMQPTTGTAT
jgi:pimeloyl-ACP methyl ester carboxylesterase